MLLLSSNNVTIGIEIILNAKVTDVQDGLLKYKLKSTSTNNNNDDDDEIELKYGV